jgi:hypothetical protein
MVDRFIKTLSILILMLFLLASGIDVTLDRLEGSPRSNAFSTLPANGVDLQVDRSNLNLTVISRPDLATMPPLLRRTKASPVSTQNGYRWL